MGNGWTGQARYLGGGTKLKDKEVNIRIKILNNSATFNRKTFSNTRLGFIQTTPTRTSQEVAVFMLTALRSSI